MDTILSSCGEMEYRSMDLIERRALGEPDKADGDRKRAERERERQRAS